MKPSSTGLRETELHGPNFPGLSEPGHSFWTLVIGAPKFGLENVRPRREAVQEDRVHPVRTIALDLTTDAHGRTRWRKARLLSAHVIGGHSGDDYDDYGEINFRTLIKGRHTDNAADRRGVLIASSDGSVFRTEEMTGPQTGVARFHRILATPLLPPHGPWPERDGEIPMPACRLVQGSVPLMIRADSVPWIRGDNALELIKHPPAGAARTRGVRMSLVPEGIELEARVPLPAPNGGLTNKLPGRFLLAPDGAGGLLLRLLPAQLDNEQREAWVVAWSDLAPAGDREAELLAGMKVELRRGTLPPAFEWQVRVQNRQIVGLSPEVTVPAEDVLVRLLGPRGTATTEGEVRVEPAAWILAPQGNPGALEATALAEASQKIWQEPTAGWEAVWGTISSDVTGWRGGAILTALVLPPAPPDSIGSAPAPSSALRLDLRDPGDTSQFEGRLLGRGGSALEYELAHDEIRLAADLRTVQGLPDLGEGRRDPERPLLAGFVPLDDGWLQLSIPNLPRPDPAKDSELVRPPAEVPPNVLSGFLRYGEVEDLPKVLSAFPPGTPNAPSRPLTIERAPWLATVEGAQGLALALDLRASGPHQALAVLLGPELSTRGLLWFSADRPDALEALPRLGAGAGAFLDVPLEAFDIEKKPAVPVTLRQFAFTVRRAGAQQADKVERTALQLDVGFNPKATAWTQHFRNELTTGTWTTVIEKGIWLSILDAAHRVLTGAQLPDLRVPANLETSGVSALPPVLWRRHPAMPLAALMPMTRSASSAARPLESRDLIPFIVTLAEAETPLVLSWTSDDPRAEIAVFPALTAGQGDLSLRPVHGWPWPAAGTGAFDVGGIALAAFGVPGAELTFTSTDAGPAEPLWAQLRYALRFDLPALDEAFATATLPPAPEVKTPDATDAPPPPPPAATALDWRTMRELWIFQEQRHHLARVAHSHLADYAAMRQNPVPIREVRDLIGGAIWRTRLGFFPGQGADVLPYGHAIIDGAEAVGNVALLGFSGAATVRWEQRLHEATSTAEVVGYAAPTIVDGPHGEFLVDTRGTGMGAIEDGDDVWTRNVFARFREGLEAEKVAFTLCTRKSAIPVTPAEGAPALLEFWFKDLPLGENGEMLPPEEGLDERAWQDGRLPRAGCEWRLWAKNDDTMKDVFRRGRDRLPFFGFGLEPLRLRACAVDAQGAVGRAVVRCRLHLGPRVGGPEAGGNLVDLGLTRSAEGLRITAFDPVSADPLRFHLLAQEIGGQARRVEITARCRWDEQRGRPVFLDLRLMLTLLGEEREFAGATITPADSPRGNVAIAWIRPQGDGLPLAPGEGHFVVDAIEVTTATETSEDLPATDLPKITFTRWLALLPALDARDEPAPAALVATVRAGHTEVAFLGREFTLDRVALHEDDGAVSLTFAVDQPLSMLAGLQRPGTLSLGLIARVESWRDGGATRDGVARLTAGHLHGRWLTTGAMEVPDCVAFEAICKPRRVPPPQQPIPDDLRWMGAITLHFRLEVQNAIRWPKLSQAADADIRWPEREPHHGRETLAFAEGQTGWHHAVTYHFDGHRLGFALASNLAEPRNTTAVFSLPIMAAHRFTPEDGGEALAFTGVETIALGRVGALIPKPVYGVRRAAPDPLAFGARYRDLVVGGYDTGEPAPGMEETGIGRIRTVLSGALGHAFRAAFWQPIDDGHGNQVERANSLALVGGFAGFVGFTETEPLAEHAELPFLRVPVLALLDQALALGQSERDVTVAWADGTAARKVAASFRVAAAPASPAFSALRTALLAGAFLPAETPEAAIEMAILVEQSFRWNMDTPTTGALSTTIFFPAAAVAVSRLIETREPRQRSQTVLSLLAGRPIEVADGDAQPLAACLLTRAPAPALLQLRAAAQIKNALPPELATSALATLGEDVLVEPWRHPAGAEDDEISSAAATGRAFAAHPRPRVVLFRHVAQNGEASYSRIALSAPRERARFREPMRPAAFADPGRGYGLAPDGANVEAWARGVEEGRTEPFRDADAPGAEPVVASGLAALSRRLSLPAQAGAHQVWISETRAPIYLPPNDLDQLATPPIPWLAPGQSRPRLPTTPVINEGMQELFGREAPAPQWIVPAAATAASIGDRAGIVIARSIRLETALPQFAEFDIHFARFGRPAQGGAWSIRSERTPRPGPLPANTGDAARDRRPCASRLEFRRPLEVLEGPADTISGEPHPKGNYGAWVVKFAAAVDWGGMISESFDGTVAIDVELDIAPGAEAGVGLDPSRLLLGLLMPRLGGPPETLRATGSLAVGETVIPFRRALFLADWIRRLDAIDQENPAAGLRGALRFVLDPHLDRQGSAAGPALAAIATALRAGLSLPAVEVRLTLHPNSGEIPAASAPPEIRLSLDDAAAPALPEGASRPPVTLRLPLMPIVRARGALPLPPSTLLFIDPAYDATLGSQPALAGARLEKPRVVQPGPSLPSGRGEILATLYADRARANRRGSIVFMLDLAFERGLDAATRRAAPAQVDGDLFLDPVNLPGPFELRLAVTPPNGQRRDLLFGTPGTAASAASLPPIHLARVYELPFGQLLETNRTAAQLHAGDMLELSVSEKIIGLDEHNRPVLDVNARVKLSLWDAEARTAVTLAGLDGSGGAGGETNDRPLSRTVRILLTDEPIIEPPPALYAALVRLQESAGQARSRRLSLPLYAQSPLPWRVTLRDAKADFRTGYMRRAANFIWSLTRPTRELPQTGSHIVKIDRNGQTHLPPASAPLTQSFEKARRVFPIPPEAKRKAKAAKVPRAGHKRAKRDQ